MGNSTSTPHQSGGAKLYKMMKNQPSYTEDTINFRRNDLVNTLSDRSIIEVIHKDGIRLNAPKRNRYSELETQQVKNKNSNFIGGNLSVSDNELSAIKNLIVMQGGCGCGENTVLKQNGAGCGSDGTTVLDQNGGDCGSVTSSFMPQTMEVSATSVSNRNNALSIDSNLEGGSATSSFMPQTMEVSATSVSNRNNSGSATSSFMPQTMEVSATSVSNRNNALSATSTLVGGSEQESNLDSAMNRLIKIADVQFGGEIDFDLQPKHNTTSELINALSLSSNSNSKPIDYADIVGGAWGKKKNKQHIKDGAGEDIDEIDSSPTESTTTTETPEKTLMRVSKKERSKRASSTSSDGTSDSSISSITTSSSTTLNSSSSTSSSSKSSPYGASIKSISGGNIYIATESMSGGNFIDAKQFYSTENGELYSSDTNYLRNNIGKRRFK